MADKTDQNEREWRAKLDAQQYSVMRQHGTEPPFSSPLNDEKRCGLFLCAGCGKALFASDSKYDSGSGWPSFFKPIAENALGEREDISHGLVRREVYCHGCQAHLGHVFPDGPTFPDRPDVGGLRYCINGCALNFKLEHDLKSVSF